MAKEIDRIFIEYGLDFDNNPTGFGKSIEIEYKDGSEERVKPFKIRLKDTKHYFRIWIFKTVIIITLSEKRFKIKNKLRNNFKIVYGISGLEA